VGVEEAGERGGDGEDMALDVEKDEVVALAHLGDVGSGGGSMSSMKAKLGLSNNLPMDGEGEGEEDVAASLEEEDEEWELTVHGDMSLKKHPKSRMIENGAPLLQ
jgi:hypothetical protein